MNNKIPNGNAAIAVKGIEELGKYAVNTMPKVNPTTTTTPTVTPTTTTMPTVNPTTSADGEAAWKMYDQAKGAAQTQYDNSLGALNTQYANAGADLLATKKSSQQAAAVNLAKLQKYLPQQMKQQGLGGLGVSQTAQLRANNSYMAQMGQIGKEYAQGQRDLLTNYTNAKATLDNTKSQSDLDAYKIYTDDQFRREDQAFDQNATAAQIQLAGEDQAFNQGATAAQIQLAGEDQAFNQNATATQIQLAGEDQAFNQNLASNEYNDNTEATKAANEQTAYETIMGMIEGGAFATWKDADSYIRKHAGELGSRFDEMSVWLNSYKDDYAALNEEEAAKTATGTDATFNRNGVFGATDFRAGDNFSVKGDDVVYRVESGGEVMDQGIIESASGISNNMVFSYGDQLYLKKDGKIYSIQKRPGQGTGRDNDKGFASLYKYIQDSRTSSDSST